MIIALLNQKGGVGKTTLATHIAGELAMRGQQVVLLDADPQGSALDWTQRRAQQGKVADQVEYPVPHEFHGQAHATDHVGADNGGGA